MVSQLWGCSIVLTEMLLILINIHVLFLVYVRSIGFL